METPNNTISPVPYGGPAFPQTADVVVQGLNLFQYYFAHAGPTALKLVESLSRAELAEFHPEPPMSGSLLDELRWKAEVMAEMQKLLAEAMVAKSS